MSALTGTGALIRLILRRDRFILPIWIIFLAIVPMAGVAAFKDLYPTAAARESFTQLARANPAFTAMYGPIYGSSLGALVAWRYSIVAVFAALGSFLTVVRHTRTEEEAGRRELLSSTVVSRHAGLTAALIVVFSADLLLAALIAGSLAGQGLPVGGSMALGLAYGAAGLVFAAVGALAAQLTQNAGSARGIAGSVLGASFLLRAVGDGSSLSWLDWLSPLGWSGLVRPFAGEHWLVLVLFAGAAIVISAAAFVLSDRRDMGAGILPARLGPATGDGLGTPLGLASRLQRNLLISWTFGIALFAFLIGNIADSFADLLKDNPQLEAYFATRGGAAGLTDSGIASLINIMALVLAGYAVQSTLKLRSEELTMRTQPVLATAVGRLRYAASHLVFAIAGPAVVLALAGSIIGLTYGSLTGKVGGEIWRILGAALVQLPAVWILAGLTMALHGLLPRFAASGAWTAMAVFAVFGVFGELLRIPDRLLDISPFKHVPPLPGGDFTAAPVVWLTVIAAALATAGLVGFRRRDIG